MSGLDTPLTPLRFLERAAAVHPDRIAVVDGTRRWTYGEFAQKVTAVARALRVRGITSGDRVAFLGTNSAELLTAHFAVPLAGAVLVALNTRLSAEEISYICDHSKAKLLLGDPDLLDAFRSNSDRPSAIPTVQVPAIDGTYLSSLGAMTYADFLTSESAEILDWEVTDESAVIAINYTSGTTGRPKGVEYTHRGAYLNALGEAHHQGLTGSSRYLWTLPMFHCSGWCTTWGLTAVGGTHVCIRAVRGSNIWSLIDTEGITHLAGAPIVLTTIAEADEVHPIDRPLAVITAGAAPSPAIISRMREIGAEVIHVYGLTETYGPYAVCEPGDDWSRRPVEEQSRLMARQGVGMITSDRVRVVRAERAMDGHLIDTVADGVEMGEIVMRGNSVMKGYHRDPVATEEAFSGGWFHSGDLGVMYEDGYVKLLDRAKDIVISGGENISTVEIEQSLLDYPGVMDVAVVGVPDEKWGERPKAFVVIQAGCALTDDALIMHLRQRIAHYKVPNQIEFVPSLPRTSTGKVRKSELRDRSPEVAHT